MQMTYCLSYRRNEPNQENSTLTIEPWKWGLCEVNSSARQTMYRPDIHSIHQTNETWLTLAPPFGREYLVDYIIQSIFFSIQGFIAIYRESMEHVGSGQRSPLLMKSSESATVDVGLNDKLIQTWKCTITVSAKIYKQYPVCTSKMNKSPEKTSFDINWKFHNYFRRSVKSMFNEARN